MSKRTKPAEDPRRLPRYDSRRKDGIVLSREPLKLTIEAIVNESAEKWCSACQGPAPVGVAIAGVTSEGRFLLCHPCADRIGGQSSRLSALLREQLDETKPALAH